VRSIFRRAKPAPPPERDPLWFHPETDGPNSLELELLAKHPWTPPPAAVEVAQDGGRLVVLRIDLTFMGIPIWSDEPVVFPVDVDNQSLGATIRLELGSRRLGLPSPTMLGWEAVGQAMSARLGVASVGDFVRQSRMVSASRDADGFVVTPIDTSGSPESVRLDSLAVRSGRADDGELGALVRASLDRAHCAPATGQVRSTLSLPRG
jgi:hypothetical protein